mmetsp:Transcript_39179/g.93659  ORF Transcript_39179/g.93659 Transcript_39179/m.93659 type:complete len:140 (-) Transcript_39179:374-793(-)
MRWQSPRDQSLHCPQASARMRMCPPWCSDLKLRHELCAAPTCCHYPTCWFRLVLAASHRRQCAPSSVSGFLSLVHHAHLAVHRPTVPVAKSSRKALEACPVIAALQASPQAKVPVCCEQTDMRIRACNDHGLQNDTAWS